MTLNEILQIVGSVMFYVGLFWTFFGALLIGISKFIFK